MMQWSGVMNKNNLMLSCAGSGKTTYIVKKALSLPPRQKVLITTYTDENTKEIVNKIIQFNKTIPLNITIQPWFSFLLQHGVRPYQNTLCDDIHEWDIGFLLTNEKSGKRFDKDGAPLIRNGRPQFYKDTNIKKCYFTKSHKIYSDKISKFIFNTNKKSGGRVISRLEKLFDYIFIDEVQDLAGFDLDIIYLLFIAKFSITLVGDLRQTTFKTHNALKNTKTVNKKKKLLSIFEYVNKMNNKKQICEIDTTTLNKSHRNNQIICDYSSKLYRELPLAQQCECPDCHTNNDHQGVFFILESEISSYVNKFSPVQLSWNKNCKFAINTKTRYNFGQSKGSTYERVLIFPTLHMKYWVFDNNYDFENSSSTKAKLYVALTRARVSATIVLTTCKEMNKEFLLEKISTLEEKNVIKPLHDINNCWKALS